MGEQDILEEARTEAIEQKQLCEVPFCQALSVNICYQCWAVMCQQHSHPSISDDGRDIVVCPECFYL